MYKLLAVVYIYISDNNKNTDIRKLTIYIALINSMLKASLCCYIPIQTTPCRDDERRTKSK